MTFSVFSSDGELFLKKGRPGFELRGCAIVCTTTYRMIRTGERLLLRTKARSFPERFGNGHAESVALNEVNMIEKQLNW
jgi:hypothetical protein